LAASSGAASSAARTRARITDLQVVTDGTLGDGHSIQHVSGTDAKCQPMDLVVRVTDAYRKVGNG
jgi:ketosteroid isomerase-like protein